jgi:hypothetical protein
MLLSELPRTTLLGTSVNSGLTAGGALGTAWHHVGRVRGELAHQQGKEGHHGTFHRRQPSGRLDGRDLQMLSGSRKGRTPVLRRLAECLLGWSLPLNVGVMGIFFLGHTARVAGGCRGVGMARRQPLPNGGRFRQPGLRRARAAVCPLAGSVLVRHRRRPRDLHAQRRRFACPRDGKKEELIIGERGTVFYYDVLVPPAHLGLLSAYGRGEPDRKPRFLGRF